jgi:hypothetical protein
MGETSMATPQRYLRATAVACLTAAVVTACGSHTSAAPTTQAPVSALAAADDKACAGIEAILAHVTVDTAHWSPGGARPFDQGIATRLATQTRYLTPQAQGAGPRVRRAVASTATAFDGVAEAIMTKNRAGLEHAILRSRTAYSGLKQACKIHN